MIFSKSKQIQHRRFSYEPRYAKGDNKEKVISFREEGAFLARKEEVAGSMRNLKYAKRAPKRSVHKFTKFILLCALMGVIYLMYSDAFVISEAWGGELTKVLFGFAILFVFLFYFIKKSNSSI